MEYQQTQYERDCLEAAKSDSGFDKVNAKEIAVLHGRDLKEVLAEIKQIRAFRMAMQG